MSEVLLVTCADFPEGEEWTGTSYLLEAFDARGIDARWVAWDDPDVDWSSALVCVRATWDYQSRLEEFLTWAKAVPRMLNSAAVFAWNTDKRYLLQLMEAGVPVVPTLLAESEEELPAAIAEFRTAVVKPTVGAGGRGVVVFDGVDGGPRDLDESELWPGPWVVQPLVESVHTEGETSVFVLDSEVVSQAQKRPGPDDIRVHEYHGGSTVAAQVTDEAVALAHRAVAAAEELLGERLDYARVDQMRLADGTLAVSELELTEPGLYLEVLPGNAERFVDLVTRHLGSV